MSLGGSASTHRRQPPSNTTTARPCVGIAVCCRRCIRCSRFISISSRRDSKTPQLRSFPRQSTERIQQRRQARIACEQARPAVCPNSDFPDYDPPDGALCPRDDSLIALACPVSQQRLGRCGTRQPIVVRGYAFLRRSEACNVGIRSPTAPFGINRRERPKKSSPSAIPRHPTKATIYKYCYNRALRRLESVLGDPAATPTTGRWLSPPSTVGGRFLVRYRGFVRAEIRRLLPRGGTCIKHSPRLLQRACRRLAFGPSFGFTAKPFRRSLVSPRRQAA